MEKIFKIKFLALLTMRGETLEKGELIVEGGKIREVSTSPLDCPGAEVLDLSDCLLLPGFVNAHCHLALSALQGRVSRHEKFTDWVRALLSCNAEVSFKDRVRKIHSAAGELIDSGVTTLAEYMSHPELLGEYASLPFRQILFLETLGFKSAAVEETMDRVRSIFESANPRGELLTLGLAPHAPYSVSPALFKELRKLALRYGCPVSCHVAEFPEEVRFLKEGGGELRKFLQERGVYDDSWTPPGKSPVRYLDDVGVLDSLVAIHLNHIDGDADVLESRQASAVFCPQSTRWFGRTSWMPVRQLLDRGLAVGLGTDSLASNESLNFLQELRAAGEMLPEVSREEILQMATCGGARALGLKTGEIAPGRPADLIGFRLREKPPDWSDVPFEPDRTGVDFSMLNGKLVVTPE